MNKYPMKLTPVPREMIWGGDRLKSKYNKSASFNNLGESWELSCRAEARSVVSNGEYCGQELCAVLGCGYNFPLLIKFIDAKDKLSVQVHPDDDVTDDNGIPLGKTEMWYIIDADEGAHIIYGMNEGVSVKDFTEMVCKGDFDSGLKKVYVKPKDCYFIPAGQVHAIGKGILLAEIQQNSDTTYRLYDYGRLDRNGNPRELHIDNALKVMKAYSAHDIDEIRFSEGHEDSCLANCSKFKCFEYVVDHDSPADIISGASFCALIFIEGKGNIVYNGKLFPAVGGDTYYIPEGISVTVCGNLTFLSASPK